jgi:hypothetical protein
MLITSALFFRIELSKFLRDEANSRKINYDYDDCLVGAVHAQLWRRFGCTFPWFWDVAEPHERQLCQGETAMRALDVYKSDFPQKLVAHLLLTTFSFHFYAKGLRYNQAGDCPKPTQKMAFGLSQLEERPYFNDTVERSVSRTDVEGFVDSYKLITEYKLYQPLSLGGVMFTAIKPTSL